jgi:hypothetical protein
MGVTQVTQPGRADVEGLLDAMETMLQASRDLVAAHRLRLVVGPSRTMPTRRWQRRAWKSLLAAVRVEARVAESVRLLESHMGMDT